MQNLSVGIDPVTETDAGERDAGAEAGSPRDGGRRDAGTLDASGASERDADQDDAENGEPPDSGGLSDAAEEPADGSACVFFRGSCDPNRDAGDADAQAGPAPLCEPIDCVIAGVTRAGFEQSSCGPGESLQCARDDQGVCTPICMPDITVVSVGVDLPDAGVLPSDAGDRASDAEPPAVAGDTGTLDADTP